MHLILAVVRYAASISTLSLLLLPCRVLAAENSSSPTSAPSDTPSLTPNSLASLKPSSFPSLKATSSPSFLPSVTPSTIPTNLLSPPPSLNPFRKPTNAPILRPTVRPIKIRPSNEPSQPPVRTAGPTAATGSPTPTKLQLLFTQSLMFTLPSGCKLLNYDEKSQSALAQTTAVTMQVQLSYVTYSGCESSGSTAAAAQPINANFNVNIPLVDLPATVVVPSNTSSIRKFYNNLQQKLIRSIQTGDFNSQLASISKYYNATLMFKTVVSKTKASAMTVQDPPTLAPTSGPKVAGTTTDSNSSGNNGTTFLIIGIVAGLAFLLFFAAACLTIFYIRFSTEKSSETQVISHNNPAFSATSDPTHTFPATNKFEIGDSCGYEGERVVAVENSNYLLN